MINKYFKDLFGYLSFLLLIFLKHLIYFVIYNK